MEGKEIHIQSSRLKVIGYISFITFLLMVPSVASAGNQGLSWAVPIGEAREFELYRMRNSTIMGYTLIDETITYEITENPVLPDNITVWASYDEFVGIPQIERVGYWENGTDMGMSAWYVITPILLPVGNWTLIASLMSDYIAYFSVDYTTQIINDAQRIGFRYSTDITDYSEIREAWWSKTDGLLIHYRWYQYDFSVEGFESESDIVVDAVQPPVPWSTIMLIGGVTSVVVVVGAVVFLRRKS